jgi:hypothetical protein
MMIPFDINQGSLSHLMGAIKPGLDRRFIYLDGSWKEQDRLSMFAELVKHRILGLFGASPYLSNRRAVVLAEPAGCRPGEPIDWRLIWDSQRFHDSTKG